MDDCIELLDDTPQPPQKSLSINYPKPTIRALQNSLSAERPSTENNKYDQFENDTESDEDDDDALLLLNAPAPFTTVSDKLKFSKSKNDTSSGQCAAVAKATVTCKKSTTTISTGKTSSSSGANIATSAAGNRSKRANSWDNESDEGSDELEIIYSQRDDKEATNKRKKLQKEMEKARRKNEREHVSNKVKASQGKLAHTEICVIMESHSLLQSDIGVKIRDGLTKIPDEMGYMVVSNMSDLDIVPNGIRFASRSYENGGAAAKGKGVVDEGVFVIVFPEPRPFLDLLAQDSEEELLIDNSEDNIVDSDELYPRLEKWVLEVRKVIAKSSWRGIDNPSDKNIRLVLLLHGVEEELVRLWNEDAGSRRCICNEEELYDAVVHLMVQHRIETELASSWLDVVDYMISLTRALSEKDYYQETSELDCVKMIKSRPDIARLDSDHPFEVAKGHWYKQLQQLPRLSAAMAENVLKYYPTAASLYVAYQDSALSEDQKRMLLAKCFSESTTQAALSNMIYKLFNSNDPQEMI